MKPGDWVVYPNRRGSDLWMEEARILEVRSHAARRVPMAKAEKSDGRKVTLSGALRRMVKAPDGWQPDSFN